MRNVTCCVSGLRPRLRQRDWLRELLFRVVFFSVVVVVVAVVVVVDVVAVAVN